MLLHPGLHEAGHYGRRVADGLPADFDFFSLMFPPVASAAPGFTMVLPVFKPLGPDPQDHGNGQVHGE